MNNHRAGQLSTGLFVVSIVCIVLIDLRILPAYSHLFQIIFVLTGATAIITALVASRLSEEKLNFNLLFWISNLVIYAGLLMKIYHQPYHQQIIIAGAALAGISYFFNPFKTKSDSEDDELLDQ